MFLKLAKLDDQIVNAAVAVESDVGDAPRIYGAQIYYSQHFLHQAR